MQTTARAGGRPLLQTGRPGPRRLHGYCAAACRDEIRRRLGSRHGRGRSYFLPEAIADPEYPDNEKKKAKRKDGRDLTKAWLDRYGDTGAYVWNKEPVHRDRPGKDRSPARSVFPMVPAIVAGQHLLREPRSLHSWSVCPDRRYSIANSLETRVLRERLWVICCSAGSGCPACSGCRHR